MSKRGTKAATPPMDAAVPAAPAAVTVVNNVVSSMELTVVQTAITDMNAVNAGLAALREKYGKAVFDCSTDQGMADAKAARKEIAAPRIQVEKIRAAAKRPILDLGAKLDAEARRIKEELEALEKPIDQQIEAEETRLREEMEARERAEAQRVSAILERIADIRDTPRRASLVKTAVEVHQFIETLVGVNVDDSFAEFADQANEALQAAILQVREMYQAARAREAEAAAIAEQRAALEKAQAEQAERDRKRREEEAAERRRVDAIHEDIRELRGNRSLTASSGAALIASHIFDLENLPVTVEKFAEYLQQAQDAREVGIAWARNLHTAALAHEAEQARLKQQREEQEAQRVELARIEAVGARCRAILNTSVRAAECNTTAEAVRLIASVEAVVIDDYYRGQEVAAQAAKDSALAAKDSALANLRARLDVLKASEEASRQEAERQRQEREAAAARETEEAQRFEREGPPKLDEHAEGALAVIDVLIREGVYCSDNGRARVTWYVRRWSKALGIELLVRS